MNVSLAETYTTYPAPDTTALYSNLPQWLSETVSRKFLFPVVHVIMFWEVEVRETFYKDVARLLFISAKHRASVARSERPRVCGVLQERASEEQTIYGSILRANIQHLKRLETNGFKSKQRNTTDSFLLPRVMCLVERELENQNKKSFVNSPSIDFKCDFF